MDALIQFARKYRHPIVFGHDLLCVLMAWTAACWMLLPYISGIPAPWVHTYWHMTFVSLGCILVIQGMLFFVFGLYRGVWRFASLRDLKKMMAACLPGSFFAAVLTYYSSILSCRTAILYGIFLPGLLSLSRLTMRWRGNARKAHTDALPVIIAGAGNAGEGLIRDMLRDTTRRYTPVALVDDDPARLGHEIHGIRVAGALTSLPQLVQKLGAKLVLIAIPSASSASMRAITRICETAGVPHYTLPGISDLADGRVSISVLRNICLEDLLGRYPVTCQWGIAQTRLAGKTVLVTGGGGSIGSELCRQIVSADIKKLIILDSCEYNLYQIDRELRETARQRDIHCVLLSVTDRPGIENLFDRHHPELVFHAAACKHVPLLEHQARMAMLTNITGTRIVAENAMRTRAQTFVLISSDKAVNPANVMGATKRAAEYFCQNISEVMPEQTQTRFITVRFGNVLGSAGSVVPLFRQQIEAGGPVTVTHPDIIRFFMTIPEASQLILQAAFLGKGGEIFILDMGDPIRIGYLAEQMIRLAGKIPHEDIKIIYTGLRPGEKLYEECFYPNETLQPTGHPKIRRAQSQPRPFADILTLVSTMEEICNAVPETPEALMCLLHNLVPEYTSPTLPPVTQAGTKAPEAYTLLPA